MQDTYCITDSALFAHHLLLILIVPELKADSKAKKQLCLMCVFLLTYKYVSVLFIS